MRITIKVNTFHDDVARRTLTNNYNELLISEIIKVERTIIAETNYKQCDGYSRFSDTDLPDLLQKMDIKVDDIEELQYRRSTRIPSWRKEKMSQARENPRIPTIGESHETIKARSIK